VLGATPEAGHRLADRYRLLECIDKHNGTSIWYAMDEKLCRPVGIHVMSADHELAAAVVSSAQAASGIDDGRFLRVLDAVQRTDIAYVVQEWAPEARRLSDVLATEGPMDPLDALNMITEAAEAMAIAHAAGLSHLRLRPDTVLLTPSGQVKIVGLCVEAALHGTTVPDAAGGDAKGLGRVLYSALTARWPEGEAFGLQAAPFEHGAICTPRQVRAGVPDGLDAVVDRVLNFNPRAGAPLRSPEEIVAALRQLPRPRPPSGSEVTGPMAAVTGILAPMPTKDGWRPSAATRGVQFAVATMLVLGLVLLTWQILRVLNPGDRPSAAETIPITGPMQGIRISSVRDFDPPPGGNGIENGEQARFAADGRKGTTWKTVTYATADFGKLKPGVGLVVDLGKAATVRQVKLRLLGEGTGIEVRAAEASVDSAPAETASYLVAASKQDAGQGEILRFAFPTKTRFLLIWLVQLPRDPSGPGYRGGLSEISVAG
jgi:hypothetical protein